MICHGKRGRAGKSGHGCTAIVVYQLYNSAVDCIRAIDVPYYRLACLTRLDALGNSLISIVRSRHWTRFTEHSRLSFLFLILWSARPTVDRWWTLPFENCFVRAHGLLFEKTIRFRYSFDSALYKFTGQLNNNFRRIATRWKEGGARDAIANLSSLLSVVGGTI